jgi:hypothetical protein
MKLTLLLIPFLFLASCGPEKTRISIPEGFKGDNMSWKDYHKYCGPQNLFNKQNFSKIKKSNITWKGTVAQVLDDDSSNNYAKKVVRVKMDGTASVFADIVLRMPVGSEKVSAKAVKGDKIAFQGTIGYIGSGLNDHIIRVTRYKFTRPPKKKK